jgi:hypothetical protein
MTIEARLAGYVGRPDTRSVDTRWEDIFRDLEGGYIALHVRPGAWAASARIEVLK